MSKLVLRNPPNRSQFDVIPSDPVMLATLVDMGYDSRIAEIALSNTQNKGVGFAIEYIIENQDSIQQQLSLTTPNVDEAQPAPTTTAEPQSTTTTTDEFKPIPRVHLPGSTALRGDTDEEKQRFQEKQRQKAIEEARREKEAKKRELELIRKQMAAEKEAKKRAQAATSPTPTPAPASSTASSSTGSADVTNTECLVQIRVPGGATLKQTFNSADTLSAIRDFLLNQSSAMPQHFSIIVPGFPKKEYTEDSFHTTTLQQAELAPRGSVIIQPAEARGVVTRGYAPQRPTYSHYDDDDDDQDHGEMSYEQMLALEERMGSVSRGLPAAVLGRLPVFDFQDKRDPEGNPIEDEKCVVCFAEFQNGDSCCQLPCKHSFHRECIFRWFGSNNTCPICKRSVIACLAGKGTK